MNLENKTQTNMQAVPIKGENGNYVFFPNNKETIINHSIFSVDFLGFNVDDKSKVICKQVNPELLNINRKKLELYVEASERLKHENITNTKDIIISDKNLLVIKEFIEHDTLKDLIYNRKLKTSKYEIFFLKVIIQALIGLEYLHANSLTYYNLKPENILIAHHFNAMPNYDEPSVKLADFEFIKPSFSELNGLWSNKCTQGIMYASPEQVLNVQKLVGSQSDIYNMGMVLYETVAKKHNMSDHTNSFFIKRMQYSTPLINSHGIDELMFNIVQKACIKMEFQKSSRHYIKEQTEKILKIGIDNRFKSAKEFGISLANYLEQTYFKAD